MTGGLGRLVPPDFDHLDKYPLRALAPTIPATAERVLKLPAYRKQYDQGETSECVGFSLSWLSSIDNEPGHRYDPAWLYGQAQAIDGDPSPHDGTTVRAGMEVLRTQGHVRVERGRDDAPNPAEGIAVYRWAQTVDEIRAAIAGGSPVVFGINWYSAFDSPEKGGNDWWIGRGELGTVRGGHAICGYGVSDRRQAVKLVNSWGTGWPLVWVPYRTVETLLANQGECGLVTDQ